MQADPNIYINKKYIFLFKKNILTEPLFFMPFNFDDWI
jgi:hypothetical protein